MFCSKLNNTMYVNSMQIVKMTMIEKLIFFYRNDLIRDSYSGESPYFESMKVQCKLEEKIFHISVKMLGLPTSLRNKMVMQAMLVRHISFLFTKRVNPVIQTVNSTVQHNLLKSIRNPLPYLALYHASNHISGVYINSDESTQNGSRQVGKFSTYNGSQLIQILKYKIMLIKQVFLL